MVTDMVVELDAVPENRAGVSLIRMENDQKYVSDELRVRFRQKVIAPEYFPAYSLQSNSLAQQFIRTLLSKS